jgi:hypothetical protein|eukprot:SAG25_NODE_2010_length_2030_cov_1.228379_3_plen_37_part_00
MTQENHTTFELGQWPLFHRRPGYMYTVSVPNFEEGY